MAIRKRIRISFAFFYVAAVGFAFFGGVSNQVSGEDKGAEHAVPATSASPQVDAGESRKTVIRQDESACLVEPAAIEDLKKQKEVLQAQMNELSARESELKAREAALNEEFKKLEVLRGDLGKIEGSRRQENEGRIGKLVETFETMSPKAASQVIAGLDESLAVAAMSKISTQKLAKILNVMEPRRSARLTELMAGVVRAREATRVELPTASSDAAVTTKMLKGGEKK